MIDYDAEYKATVAEFERERRWLNLFFRGLMLLGLIGIAAVVAIDIAYG